MQGRSLYASGSLTSALFRTLQ